MKYLLQDYNPNCGECFDASYNQLINISSFQIVIRTFGFLLTYFLPQTSWNHFISIVSNHNGAINISLINISLHICCLSCTYTKHTLNNMSYFQEGTSNILKMLKTTSDNNLLQLFESFALIVISSILTMPNKLGTINKLLDRVWRNWKPSFFFSCLLDRWFLSAPQRFSMYWWSPYWRTLCRTLCPRIVFALI